MADSKITGLTSFDSSNTPYWPPAPASDVIPIVDISDNTMAASGTTKKISINNLLSSSPTAGGNFTITGDLTVDTSTLKVDSANNRVGIGTASPIIGSSLDVRGAVGTGIEIQSLSVIDTSPLAINNGGGLSFGYVYQSPSTVIGRAGSIKTIKENATDGNYASAMVFGVTANGEATTERYRIASNGVATWSNVGGVAGTAMTLNSNGLGIGVTPAGTGGCLQLKSGITFPATQVASSDANTLDDYEEGTFTPSITFGGASVGMTGTFNGRYTKVGRAVTINAIMALTAKGSSTGIAKISGLPFTSANASGEYTAISIRLDRVSFADYPCGYVGPNSSVVELENTTNAGTISYMSDSNFINTSVVLVNFTYTV